MITIVIIILTVLISLSADKNPELKMRLIMNAYMVKHRRQYYRLLTSGFIHGGYAHLGFNMFTLYFFGGLVEQLFQNIFNPVLGAVTYVLFYLMGIVASDIVTVFKQGDNLHYNSLGASGGVSSVLFCSILFFPLNKIYLLFLPGIPGFIFGILYLMYSYFQGKRMADNINHDAHMYGALFGLVFSIAVYPPVVMEFFQQIASFDLGVF